MLEWNLDLSEKFAYLHNKNNSGVISSNISRMPINSGVISLEILPGSNFFLSEAHLLERFSFILPKKYEGVWKQEFSEDTNYSISKLFLGLHDRSEVVSLGYEGEVSNSLQKRSLNGIREFCDNFPHEEAKVRGHKGFLKRDFIGIPKGLREYFKDIVKIRPDTKNSLTSCLGKI